MLYGTAEAEPQADIVVAQLAQELYNSNLLLLLVQNLSRIDFEVRFINNSSELLHTVLICFKRKLLIKQINCVSFGLISG